MEEDAYSKTKKKIESIFGGDGADIREQFLLSGLLLTVFERFKDYVISQVDGFYSNHLEIKDGRIHVERGEEFKNLIKEKGRHQSGQHANAAFRAALHWFHDFGVVSRADLDEIERIYVLRNQIGHELLQILADGKKKPITIFDVLLVFSVYVSIVRWWWKEVEATTDPDFDQEKYDNTDWDSLETVDTILLREIIQKSLSGNPMWDAVLNGLKPSDTKHSPGY